jgi:Ca2+-binding EF-hand superfamily protein
MKKLAVVLLALVSVTAVAKDRASRFDKDGDSRVSYVELTEKCEVRKSLFEKADKDGDGVLSNSEMKTAKEYLFKNRCDKVEDKNA